MDRYKEFGDVDLLGKLKAGDELAFERLYQIYSPQIYKKLLKLLKQENIAEELLQDVFVKVWEKRDVIDLEKSFRAYLYRIAQNLVYDLFRRAAFDRKMLAELISSSTEVYDPVTDAYSEKDYNTILQQVVAILPEQRRKIYTLVKIEGKSYAEVSKLLGISTSTVSDHIVKANVMLKEHFAANHLILAALVASFIIS